MAGHRVRIALRWSDTDAYGHVNNVQFLRLLEEARVRALHDWARDGTGSLVGGGLLVADARIEYVSPLLFRPDPVPIDIWVTDVRAASFRFCYEILDDGRPAGDGAPGIPPGDGRATSDTAPPGDGRVAPDALCARAETTMVLFDLGAGRPRRMNGAERSGLHRRIGDPVAFKRS